MFLRMSVILFTGGGLPQCMLAYHPPLDQAPPRDQAPPWEQTPPHPPADGYCCGWYASYWNAFLFSFMFVAARCEHEIGFSMNPSGSDVLFTKNKHRYFTNVLYSDRTKIRTTIAAVPKRHTAFFYKFYATKRHEMLPFLNSRRYLTECVVHSDCRCLTFSSCQSVTRSVQSSVKSNALFTPTDSKTSITTDYMALTTVIIG